MADATVADASPAPAPSPPAAPPRTSLRETAALLAVLALAGALHLLRPNREAHLHAAPLAGPVAYAFNADSAPYARLVVTFPRGFDDCEQGRSRRMRPLYPAAGWILYQALRPAAGLIPDRWAAQAAATAAGANHPEIWRGIDGRDLVRAWAALVLLNVLMAGAALLLLHRAFLALVDRPFALALAALPALHFDVVDFLLVPSTEPLNLLLPAIAVHAMAVTWARGRAGLAGAAALGLGQLGKGLAYPAASWAYEWLRGRGAASPPLRTRAALAALAAFAAPAALYLLLVLASAQPATYPETEQYRQVVWMGDYAREGRLAAIPLRWAEGLARHAFHVLQGFWPALLVALAALLRRGGRPLVLPGRFLRHLAVATAACAAFWCLVGYLHPRLAVGQFPLVATLLGAAAARASDRPERWAWGAVALMAVARAAGLFPF